MTRTGRDATDWAKANAHRGIWYRQCLSFVRQSFGRPGGVRDAGTAWDNAQHKHRTNDGMSIPAGVPVFWETPGRADHIAISVGSGLCRSTDVVQRGDADIVGINSLTRRWGIDLLGWTEDLNGDRVYHPRPTGPVLDVSDVVAAARTNSKVNFGVQLKKAVAAEVGKGKMVLTTASLGPEFRTQYSLVQRKYLQASHAAIVSADVNGIPGKNSLAWLGQRHGFTTKG